MPIMPIARSPSHSFTTGKDDVAISDNGVDDSGYGLLLLPSGKDHNDKKYMEFIIETALKKY